MHSKARMIDRMVVRIDEKGWYGGIIAGFAGLKNAFSRGTMDAGIELRM